MAECDQLSCMAKNTSRRNFLRTAPVAAAAGFTLIDSLKAKAQEPGAEVVASASPFKLFKASELEADVKALQSAPGNNNLLMQSAGFPCAIVMTTETHKSAAEFEWHEGRDHIVQILDGMTVYEIGGTPKGGHVNKGPGEWLAPHSEGSKSFVLGKGDMLGIPRGTPHKRSTEDSVTFLLISPYGAMKA
jgi:mannose-6-phosphate isomerase-like protein (cupin superfamily)